MNQQYIKSFIKRGDIIQFELDEWYKEPEKFHRAVVSHLEKEGKHVETISIVAKVYSNKISTLLIDGLEYELSVKRAFNLGPTQVVILRKVEE
ncbi:hypothetical protein [Peribacillus sp. SCS-37]|uniref:hypothetical protein n=1 Tax=Paraperibacillus esterisolvens TaxID=3115296 RepID=UPI003905A4B1